MNQAFILNDDLTLNQETGVWQVTGMLSGQTLTFNIAQELLLETDPEIDKAMLQFDIEALIEDWLDENEPNSNEITID
ncbi:hypothetical protein C2869_07915 [Saccharobesus litoralis]|uniref:Uncharacterized protein n=1 Tax=Saccharobesus litoralis TaxID=2172099 RepID=A0A2S0VQ66_9ALTE|nr:hypothetical protein [Saccharobesus litoralis]AWB66358.1 hypothetical protein C2869_07915 [Saccharobesus litoralis]